jgi:cell fate (sporulation/competence/biofilm development) regulator YlbF (YheA/YmcA/DUF963 family)
MICKSCCNSNCNNDDIINKINKIDDKMNIILSVLGNLKIDSKSLEDEMNDLKNKIDEKDDKGRKKTNKNLNNNIREIKKEQYNLDEEFVKECLNSGCIDADIKIFKKIYIDNLTKESYSIKHIRKKFQYWYNGSMKDDDSNCTYIKNTIVQNIEDCYLNVNKYESYQDDIDQFINNQEYINKMSEQKYKERFLLKIIELI